MPRSSGTSPAAKPTGSATRSTLLERVKNHADGEAWREFYDLYAPMLYRYARDRGLSRPDAEEVRDHCLAAVSRRIGEFQYDRAKGGFRSWLRRVVDHRIIDQQRRRRPGRADSAMLRLQADRGHTPEELWERNWRIQHLRHCVRQVEGEVPERDYRVFCLLTLQEVSVVEACEREGLNPNQVYKAKHRVLQLVRKKLAELDPESDL